MSLKAIAEYADRIEAEMARLALAAEGIDAHIFDGGMAGLGLGFMTPARVMVLPEDAAAARLVLEKLGEA
jgi:cell division protein FtsN